ncbi:hypothetical protein RQP46_009239 [Phenoliferia psychrophenolica]
MRIRTALCFAALLDASRGLPTTPPDLTLSELRSSLSALHLLDFTPGSTSVKAACVDPSGNVISTYQTVYKAVVANLGGMLPASKLIVLQFTMDAYLNALFFVPPQAELYGNIEFILTSATNAILGGTVTASTLLSSYIAELGASATPSKGTLATLPKDFYFGVSSSGYQSEGNQGMKIDSNFQRSVDRGEQAQTYYNAVNFWERYPEDIGLAADMGLTNYRIGVQWNRLEPKQGEFNLTAFSIYKDIVSTIRKAGLTPIVTHSFPNWLRYAKAVVDLMYDPSNEVELAPVWLSINEAALYFLIEDVALNDILPSNVPAMFERLVQVHREIYESDGFIECRISTVNDSTGITHALDGTNYDGLIESEGIYYVLDYYHRKFGPSMPLWITETGLSTKGGAPRADGYTLERLVLDSVYWLQRAKADGINVIGFNVWSLTDNYELGSYV